MTFLTIVAIIALVFISLTVVIVPMRDGIVIERLGKFLKVGHPGPKVH